MILSISNGLQAAKALYAVYGRTWWEKMPWGYNPKEVESKRLSRQKKRLQKGRGHASLFKRFVRCGELLLNGGAGLGKVNTMSEVPSAEQS